MVWFRAVSVWVMAGACAAFACDRSDTGNAATTTSAESAAIAKSAPTAAATAPTAASAAPPQCAEICDHVRPLRCSDEARCLAQCQEMSSVAVCHAEMLTVLSCMAKEPAASFECDPEVSAAALREGVCSAEQARFAACYDARSARP